MSTPADTNEWRWIPVYEQTNPQDPESKELFTGGIEYAVYRDGTAPTSYTPAVIRDGLAGIIIVGLAPGTYRVRARITGGATDRPTINCGTFTLTH